MSDLGHEPTAALPKRADPNAGAFTDPHELIGTTIAGRYRVRAVLGRGGMGSVLRCYHLGLQTEVAVKLLHPQLSDNPELAQRFEREAQSTSRLEHPNCVRVIDFGEWAPPGAHTPLKYLAMQLLEGAELRTLLRRPLPPKRATDLMLQIVCGLEHAHSRGVVHRDLKPENVFVTRDHDGRELLKLVDFGIAKIMEGPEAQKQMTRLGMVFGTPRYMSPEQAAGGRVDERTDIYAAGIIFFQMLASRVPFDGDDVMIVLRKQIAAEPPPLPASVPPGLRSIVARMLAKDRTERFPSATALRTTLEAIRASAFGLGAKAGTEIALDRNDILDESTAVLVGAPGQTVPTPSSTRTARRQRLALAGGAVAIFGLTVWWAQADEAPTTTDPSPAVAFERWFAATPLTTDERDALDQWLDDVPSEQALTRLHSLRQEYPHDAPLAWRHGRELASVGEGGAALRAYADAVANDVELLGNARFVKELALVLRKPKDRSAALALALPEFGSVGQAFVIESLADDVHPLGFDARHAAHAELRAYSTGAAQSVDQRLQLALDLWQAADASDPCEQFGAALDAIRHAPSPYFAGTLHAVDPPPGCISAEAPLTAARNELAGDVAEWTGPQAYAAEIEKAKAQQPPPKTRRRWRPGQGLRRLFGG